MATTLRSDADVSHQLYPEYVLAGRSLRADCALEQTSRFGDDIWKLAASDHRRKQSAEDPQLRAHPRTFRTTVKELFYAMLTGRHCQLEPA